MSGGELPKATAWASGFGAITGAARPPPTRQTPEQEREGDTLPLAMRSWEFAAFAQMRRNS
ncbi:hypothetical protein [Dokdonella sp.]|uniref:hypothetical protein n=1 Tax=Dokdonella sp. TaxID=2291710 RepID=UPI0027B9AB12|nr:hypothetical protein [Dokdonella sp.]